MCVYNYKINTINTTMKLNKYVNRKGQNVPNRSRYEYVLNSQMNFCQGRDIISKYNAGRTIKKNRLNYMIFRHLPDKMNKIKNKKPLRAIMVTINLCKPDMKTQARKLRIQDVQTGKCCSGCQPWLYTVKSFGYIVNSVSKRHQRKLCN